jgi:hypothetical protein
MMLPVIDAKMKFAPHGAAAHAPGTTNSLAVGLETVPVGRPPGMVMDGMPGCLKKTMLPTSPR